MSTPVTLTLHNLRRWTESYELTTDCITEEMPGSTIIVWKGVKAPDGSVGLVAESVTCAPTITIPARAKVSGIPLAARDSPAIKAAVAAGALRISEDGNSVTAPKVPVHKKSADKGV